MIDIREKRILGLDILRVFAITSVIYQHYSYLLPNSGIFYVFNFIFKPDGVTVFFLLSGFLVGNIIIKELDKSQSVNIWSLINILQRRWFKTIPAYYLILVTNIFLTQAGYLPGIINKNSIVYFAFMQNLLIPFDLFFWESWSLSVEEWFYLLFPLLLFCSIKILQRISIKKMFFYTAILFLVIALSSRIIVAAHVHSLIDYDIFIRKMVFTRFDSIAFGLFLAYLYNNYRECSLFRKPFLFSIIGAASLYYISFEMNYNDTFYFEVGYHWIEALSIALLFPVFLKIRSEHLLWTPIQFISKISYLMYLTHLLVLGLTIKLFYKNTEVDIQFVLINIVIILAISTILYSVYEKPIMHLRERVSKYLLAKTVSK